MKGKVKLVVSMALTAVMVFAYSSFAFAGEETVSATKDNITITKSAEWTQLDGKSADENGNPYAKVTFKVDTTKASTSVSKEISQGGSTDVVLVLDTSHSMLQQDKIKLAKQAAIDFTKEVMKIKTQSIRVGVVTFNSDAAIAIDLNSDEQHVIDKINQVKNSPGTNIQRGIYKAENLLKGSQAKNKIMVLLSDGRANKSISNSGPEVATGNNDVERATNQAKMATSVVPNLKLITIGYDLNDSTEKELKDMASVGANGNKMFYKASVQASQVVSDLAGVFEQISETVTSSTIGNSLVDMIPEEFEIVNDSIKVNDDRVKVVIVNSGQKNVMWNWENNALENKVYEMSLVIKLDKSKTTKYNFTKDSKIYTNGETIDVTKDSIGSSKFTYGKENMIKLTSPKLPISENSLTPSSESNKVEDGTKPIGDTNKQDLDPSPKTGDSSNVALYIVIAVCGVVMMIGTGVVIKKRHSSL